MSNFGELLRRLRGNRPQREVAADLGMPVTTLSSLENRVSPPRGSVLKRLAGHYGVPVTYFYSTPSAAMKSTQAARSWLLSLRQATGMEEAVATYGSPGISDVIKERVAEVIRRKKNAETAHDK